jgi:hypothetical protein
MQLAIKLPDERGMLQEERVLMQQSIPPKTKSLIGLMSHSGIDEADYQQYRENKYLQT